MSRPEIPIDWKKVDDLLLSGSPGTEIAAHFAMHPETFYDRVVKQYGVGFTEYLQEKRSKGDSLIRAKQFEKALKGDNMMLIWLGKNRLGQKDSSDYKMEASLTVQTIKYSETNADNTSSQVQAEIISTANPASSG